MPGNYFGGAPNAFAGGQEFTAAQRRRRQNENALNALIQRYGPEAADPASLAALQGISQDAQLFPHQHGAIAGDPAAASMDVALDDRLRGSMLNAARYLQATRRRNGDTEEAFGRVVPILSSIGMPTEQIEATRQQILTNPDSLDELVQMLSGEGPARGLSGGVAMRNNDTGEWEWVIPTETGHRVIEGYSPAQPLLAEDRLEVARTNAETQRGRLSLDELDAMGFNATPGHQYYWGDNGEIIARPIGGTAEERAANAAVTEQVAALRTSANGLRNAADVSTQALVEIDLAQHRLRDLSDSSGRISTIWRGIAGRYDQGSNEWHLQRLLESITGRNVLQTLENVDSSLYPLSDKDSETLRSALGQLRVNDDPRLIRSNLARIQEIYARTQQRSQQLLPEVEARVEEVQRRPQTPTRTPPARPQSSRPAQPRGTAPDLSTMSDEDLLRMLSGGGP
jgi:hypothetical protein